MRSLKVRIQELFAKDQLTADGGTVLRDSHGKVRKKRILKFGGSGLVFAGSLYFAIASIGLPFPGKVAAAPAEGTKVFANDYNPKTGQGTLLYTIRGDQNRSVIDFEQMPKCIKDATIAVEDKDFYEHGGFDPRGLARAAYIDILSGSTSQGGSTITQQLVKNALLAKNGIAKRSFSRKARELVLSLEIEQMYEKDKILWLYLNNIPYGSNAYGIQAASQTYFGKDAKDLTLPECATLAALPRAPSIYSPFTNPDTTRLNTRAKFIVDRMVEEKEINGKPTITEAEAVAAKAQIDQGLPYAAARGEDIKAPHFVFYVREQLEKDPTFSGAALEQKGYTIVTSLDPAKQEIAEDVVKTAARTRFAGYGASNAALTSVDPKTGQVLAMVGSVDYFDRANDGNVNVATADRQPGSSFKPLVYLNAFKEARFTDSGANFPLNPATLLWDVKTDFGGYVPNNYDQRFRGPVSARDALQQSLNVPSVKVLDMVGVPDTLNFAHRLGITTLNDPERYGDSLVLGGGEVKLVDMTAAYSVMANQGTRVPVNSILHVYPRDKKNKDIWDNKPKAQEIVSKDLAYQITDVLKDDQARAPQFGRGGPLTLPNYEVAAKTGTTDSYRDAWTMGYTSSLVAGVWLGNNDNRPMNQVGGSVGAAPIWNEYMRRALQQDTARGKATRFERPSGIKEMKVDRLTGLKPQSGAATKNELFTSENAPNDQDKSSAKASACAGKGSASGLHSERPGNANWENPVQTYIRTRGITQSGAPRNGEENSECGPEVSFVSPANGETVNGTITIQARATSENGVNGVEFSWDGQPIGSAEAPPFTVRYNITDTSGKHTISAKATDKEGNSRTATITVTVGGEESPAPTATLSLSCNAAHNCTATASDPLTEVLLVNPDTGASVSMTGTGTTYTGQAPPSWNRAYAQGKDSDGNTVRSSTRTLAMGDFTLAMLEADWFRLG